MQPKTWIRATLMAILLALLGVPPSATNALAQQEGPQKPPPAQQPEPPKPPTGQQQEKPSPAQQKPPEVAISVESNLVNVDAVVTDQDGNILAGLKKENFRILDEGQAQIITNFAPTDAPITVVILMEYSQLGYGWYSMNASRWAYEFLGHLNAQDWVALKTFALKANLEVDFTQNKGEVQQAIAGLMYPTFHEADLFDAVYETLDQLRDVKGKKAILLLASGQDTFSKRNLDEVYRRLKETEVSIFCVGVGEREMLAEETAGVLGDPRRIGYLQAKNQLNQFATMTGGYAWFPKFDGELPSIFNSVAAFLRNQYTLGFAPSTPQDGKYHKLKVEIVDGQGNPLVVTNKKGKTRKVEVYSRKGYTALKPSAAD
jgi:VWFA-related protein